MAKSDGQKSNVQTVPVRDSEKKSYTEPTNKEPKYTIEEFASAPESFGANADIVKASLLLGGKESYTVSEAKEIIKKFKEKEVK